MVDDLTPSERDVIDAMRKAQSRDEQPLPRPAREELSALLRSRVGLGARTITETLQKLDRVTIRYGGPRVILNGTLTDLKMSWHNHQDDLIKDGKSGAVLRNHREAVARYCRALELDWAPEATIYEQRSRQGRTRRNQFIELPDDFIDRAYDVVHSVQYHKDPAVNAMYQHRARFNFYTAPRCPSEDSRLLVKNVHFLRGVVIYGQSKLSGPEGDAVLVPREVFGLSPNVLTAPTRKSMQNWLQHWRPKLLAKHTFRGGTDHDYVWVTIDGTPMNPEKYRQEFSLLAKTAWPDFYPYLCRELGIIMHLLEIVQDRGHIDLEHAIQWTGHEKLDTLRVYLRKGKQLLRENKPGPELDALLATWRMI